MNLLIFKNPITIEEYLHKTFELGWHYLESLKIRPNQLSQIPYSQILDNPGDVAIGVSRVEIKNNCLFFGIFDHLVIKHFTSGEVKLMFYTEIKNPNKVFTFFRQLTENLGGGFTFGPKFSSFDMHDKVEQLAKGNYEEPTDELLQTWSFGRFSFLLNFKIDPFRQLLFSVSNHPAKVLDNKIRTKGTLKKLIRNDLNEVLQSESKRVVPTRKEGKILFTDYYCCLSRPEFGLFELVDIKLNSEHCKITSDISSVVTYYSKYESHTDKVIRLVDALVDIYGTDSYGGAELMPHDVDLIEESEYWTGRTWMINQHHALQNLDDNEQYTAYQVGVSLDPESKGMQLTILGFNGLLEYAEIMGEV